MPAAPWLEDVTPRRVRLGIRIDAAPTSHALAGGARGSYWDDGPRAHLTGVAQSAHFWTSTISRAST